MYMQISKLHTEFLKRAGYMATQVTRGWESGLSDCIGYTTEGDVHSTSPAVTDGFAGALLQYNSTSLNKCVTNRWKQPVMEVLWQT